MNQITRPPRLEVIPESAPFSEGQRSWLNGFLVGLLQLDGSVPLSPEQGDAMLQGVAGEARRRSALARPDHADCRTHEARRGTPAAPTHDGGDGAAGLRPVRL